jgi:tripartite-type tricarboxylate transporter receptor subunit TctC
LPQVQAGTLRALAVTSAAPASSLPGIETLRSRYPAIPEINTWFAVFGPKGLPTQWRDGWARQIRTAADSPEFVAQRATWGAEPSSGAHAELAQLLSSERARWSRLITDAGLRG